MGGLFGGGGSAAPAVIGPPIALPAPRTANVPAVSDPVAAAAAAGAADRSRRAAGAGFDNTVKNTGGPSGIVGSTPTTAKTLLGQ